MKVRFMHLVTLDPTLRKRADPVLHPTRATLIPGRKLLRSFYTLQRAEHMSGGGNLLPNSRQSRFSGVYLVFEAFQDRQFEERLAVSYRLQACISFFEAFHSKVAHFCFCLVRIKMLLLISTFHFPSPKNADPEVLKPESFGRFRASVEQPLSREVWRKLHFGEPQSGRK